MIIFYRGCVKEDEILLAGPQEDGSFSKVRVTSMHRNRVPCSLVKAGQAAGLALVSADESARLPVMRKVGVYV